MVDDNTGTAEKLATSKYPFAGACGGNIDDVEYELAGYDRAGKILSLLSQGNTESENS